MKLKSNSWLHNVNTKRDNIFVRNKLLVGYWEFGKEMKCKIKTLF